MGKLKIAMLKTKKNYEKHLNELLNDIHSEESALDDLCYLASDKVVRNAYNRRELGTLTRRKDPIGFMSGFNDWSR